MKSAIVLGALISAFSTFTVRASAQTTERQLVDRIVAVVNDDIVTFSELKQASAPFLSEGDDEARKKEIYAQTLEQLVAEKLLSQQVKESQISVNEEDVDRAIKDILRQNKISEADLQQAVEARGMSMGQYREDVKSQLVRLKLIDLKVRSRINIPGADIKAEYEARTRDVAKEMTVSVRHIFFRWNDDSDAEAKAKVMERTRAARERVMKGEDFSTVAKEVSEGPTATQGGSLGEMKEASLLPELATALKGKKKGDVTDVIETSGGVHIVRLDERKSSGASSYDAMRTQIYQELYQKQVETQMKAWLQELKHQGAIELRLDAA